jgi:hypothetical protein
MEQNIEQQVTRGLGQNLQDTPQPQPQPQQQKKSYDFITEIIALPSKGLGYPETSPLSKGEIEIKLMTAKEEDILASTNLIRKGVVLDKLLEAVVIQDGVKPDDLLTGDKNAILIATRILSYGADYKVKITDPITEEEVDYSIDMSSLKTKELDFSKLNRQNEYQYTTSRGTNIVFQLLTHGLEKKIDADLTAMNKIQKDAPVEITTRLRHIIKSIDGNTDMGYINKFITNKFLAADSRAFRNYVRELTPDVDFTFDYVSPITGEKEALQVPFGLDFFYPTF